MTTPSHNDAPDAEIADLISRHLDQRLDETGRARLEKRIQEEPAVREYCAKRLRFEASLQEALRPQKLEWLETRRVVVNQEGSEPEWEIQRTQTVRYGSPEKSQSNLITLKPSKRSGRGWLLAVLGLLLLAAALWYYFHSRNLSAKESTIGPRPSSLVLRNPGFETTDLALSPRGTSHSLLDWQDYFPTPKSDLCEINRVSEGKIFAKSGRNVARLLSGSYLTQRLRREDGSPLLAKPGLKIVLSGWAYAQGKPPHGMRSALRFVASSRPDQIQYEACRAEIKLQPEGWQAFRIELTLPENLTFPAYYIENVPNAPKLDLLGRELTLSIDSSCAQSLLLDDLKIEEIPTDR